jgi:hypothetical protein
VSVIKEWKYLILISSINNPYCNLHKTTQLVDKLLHHPLYFYMFSSLQKGEKLSVGKLLLYPHHLHMAIHCASELNILIRFPLQETEWNMNTLRESNETVLSK